MTSRISGLAICDLELPQFTLKVHCWGIVTSHFGVNGKQISKAREETTLLDSTPYPFRGLFDLPLAQRELPTLANLLQNTLRSPRHVRTSPDSDLMIELAPGGIGSKTLAAFQNLSVFSTLRYSRTYQLLHSPAPIISKPLG